jgi:hypothetical protein
MVRGLQRTSNLPQLQNLIKRDPASYKEEFLQQWNHYNSIRQIFRTNPDEQTSHFRELVSFISQVKRSVDICKTNALKSLPGFTILSCGDLRVSFPFVFSAPGELWVTFRRYSSQPHTESGLAQEERRHHIL